jgi:hypothetical protein
MKYRHFVRFAYWMFYYGFAIHLPISYNFRLSKKIRYLSCKKMFFMCGKNVNVEKGASF